MDLLLEEYLKLLADPCSIIPKVGSRVVVAAGLLGYGLPWFRHEAKVLEVGQVSYKVQVMTKDQNGMEKPLDMWIQAIGVILLVSQFIH